MENKDREQEFTAAFEAHADELFRHCLLRISDRERALELTQECFVRAWDYLCRGEEVRRYRSFLYRVLNNLIVDEYRRQKPQSLEAMLETDESGVHMEAELLRDESDAFEEAVTRHEASRALQALQKLPERYRAVLTLRYIDGLSPQEIARFLEETENAVSVRIHRGLKKLREALDNGMTA